MEQQMEQLMEQQQQLEQQQMEQQIGRALAPQQATQKEKQPAQAQQQPSPSTGPSSAAVQSAGGQASSSGPSGMSLHAVLERRPSAAEGRLATTPQSEHQRPMPTFASASAMVGDSSIHRACDAPGQESVRATTRDVPALPFAASPQSAPPALSHAGHRANAAGTSWIAFKDSGRDADPQHPSRS